MLPNAQNNLCKKMTRAAQYVTARLSTRDAQFCQRRRFHQHNTREQNETNHRLARTVMKCIMLSRYVFNAHGDDIDASGGALGLRASSSSSS
jgi:hypothetical protein